MEDNEEVFTDNSQDNPYNEDDEIYSGQMQNPETLDRFFNTEYLLHQIKMTLLGYKISNNQYTNTGKGLARTEFVDKIVNGLRSVMNTAAFLSKLKDEDEANRLLLEKCKEYIYAMYDEPSVDGADLEHIINIVDHSLQIFVGIIQSGGGSERAGQMMSGNYKELGNRTQEKEALFSLGNQNYDFLSFGRPKK